MVLVSSPKRPVSIHHKKRTGQHHKPTKQYSKTYWPYLPLLLIVGLGLVVSNLWGSSQKSVLGYATQMSAAALLDGTNAQRTANGQPALNLNSQLTQAAQTKANDMATRNYWSHNTPDGATPWAFIAQTGYGYQAAGENLAYGFDSSDAAVTGWMNSAEHRANILNGGFKDVGFGIANAADYQGEGPETIVVAMYGQPKAAPVVPAAASAPSAPSSQELLVNPVATESLPQAVSKPADAAQTAPAKVAGVHNPAVLPKATTPHAVARIQVLTGGAAPWSVLLVSTLASICALLFFLKHGLLWHRVLRRGEQFVIRYHLLDIAFVAIGVAGFILTRATGVIR